MHLKSLRFHEAGKTKTKNGAATTSKKSISWTNKFKFMSSVKGLLTKMSTNTEKISVLMQEKIEEEVKAAITREIPRVSVKRKEPFNALKDVIRSKKANLDKFLSPQAPKSRNLETKANRRNLSKDSVPRRIPNNKNPKKAESPVKVVRKTVAANPKVPKKSVKQNVKRITNRAKGRSRDKFQQQRANSRSRTPKTNLLQFRQVTSHRAIFSMQNRAKTKTTPEPSLTGTSDSWKQRISQRTQAAQAANKGALNSLYSKEFEKILEENNNQTRSNLKNGFKSKNSIRKIEVGLGNSGGKKHHNSFNGDKSNASNITTNIGSATNSNNRVSRTKTVVGKSDPLGIIQLGSRVSSNSKTATQQGTGYQNPNSHRQSTSHKTAKEFLGNKLQKSEGISTASKKDSSPSFADNIHKKIQKKVAKVKKLPANNVNVRKHISVPDSPSNLPRMRNNLSHQQHNGSTRFVGSPKNTTTAGTRKLVDSARANKFQRGSAGFQRGGGHFQRGLHHHRGVFPSHLRGPAHGHGGGFYPGMRTGGSSMFW